MSMNMHYCRFQNTVKALKECERGMYDTLSPDEAKARKELVELCRSIVEDYDDDFDFEPEPVEESEDE